MKDLTMLNRIAWRLASRIGSAERTEELLDHLDQLEANCRTVSFVDVGSLALLALRPPLASFAKSYAFTFVAGVVAWSLALALGVVNALEVVIGNQFGLEEFEFVERSLVLAFACVLLLAVPSYLAFIKSIKRRSQASL